MPAPLGNKFAQGHGCGRPLKYDLVQEAKDLEEWSKLPTSMSLYEFTDSKPYPSGHLSDFCKHNEIFKEAFIKAKERLAIHREQSCNAGKMNSGVWQRTVRVYDTLLRQEEEDTKDADMERRKKIAIASIPNADETMKELVARSTDNSRDIIKETIDNE